MTYRMQISDSSMTRLRNDNVKNQSSVKMHEKDINDNGMHQSTVEILTLTVLVTTIDALGHF